MGISCRSAVLENNSQCLLLYILKNGHEIFFNLPDEMQLCIKPGRQERRMECRERGEWDMLYSGECRQTFQECPQTFQGMPPNIRGNAAKPFNFQAVKTKSEKLLS